VNLKLLIERDTATGYPVEGHTISIRLELDPQERVEAQIFFCNPEHVLANCMALSSEAVSLWTRTGREDEPFELRRPWTLNLKNLTEGFVFSTEKTEALDPIETYFNGEWFRKFRREWATRKAFWTSKPQDFALECEKARETLKGIILN
jgi:hypothetical protein